MSIIKTSAICVSALLLSASFAAAQTSMTNGQGKSGHMGQGSEMTTQGRSNSAGGPSSTNGAGSSAHMGQTGTTSGNAAAGATSR